MAEKMTAKDREQLLDDIKNDLVAEVNRQIQRELGTGEDAAAKATEIFNLIDMDDLAGVAVLGVTTRMWADLSSELSEIKTKMKATFESINGVSES